MAEKITAADIVGLLHRKHGKREWIRLPEVRNTTGFTGKVRSCDFMALSLYPSKGIRLWGYEIKVSRSDWLAELRDPSKAAEFDSRCHYWTIAAAPGVVDKQELSEGWGLVVAEGDRLRVEVKPSYRERDRPDWPFVASLVRNAAKLQEAPRG